MHSYKVIGRVRDATGNTLNEQLKHFNNVQLMGKLIHSDTINEISRSKALISTSPMEGFPNIFIEAWGCGVPVLSLHVDPGEVIKNEGLGFVADGSIERMIEKMATLHRSEEFSRYARSYVHKRHALTEVRMAEIKSIVDGLFT